MTKHPKLSPKEQKELELGKKLEDFFATGYVSKKQAVLFSFLKGIAAGFGAFLGGTILVALLLWVLGFFQEIPALSHLVDLFKHNLQK